jgi:putative nucleotidyltransferase with HDIG domain
MFPVLLFLCAAAAADALSVSLPQGGRVTAAVSTSVAVALLLHSGTAVLVVLAGGIVGLFWRPARGPADSPAIDLAARVLALALTVPILRLGRATGLTVLHVDLASGRGFWTLLFVLAFCAVYLLIDEAHLSLMTRTSLRFVVLGFTSVVGPIFAALGALGLLVAVVYPSVGPWSLVLVAGLLLVVRYSFNLYTALRGTYRETIRALAEAIEAQDHLTRGHSERTADMAVQLGRQLGLSGRNLETLSYAALLHDIGRLATPEDSLDALMDSVDEGDVAAKRFHARRGAEILGQVEYLKDTATLILHHHDPWTGPECPNPLGSRIIRVASRFDHLTHPDAPKAPMGSAEALSEIKSDDSARYDPKVVRALARAASKRGLAESEALGRDLAADVE